jgi:hypothetical protein
MALTTRTIVKGFLNISASDTTLDAWIDAILPAAEAVIKTYLGRELESTTYTEFYTGDNKNFFVLRQTPVTTLTSLYFDQEGFFGTNPAGAFDSTKLLTEGVDFALDWKNSGLSKVSDTGIVWRINDVWPHWKRDIRPGTMSWVYQESRGNLKVTYVAGYSTIPSDLQMAVALLISEEMRNLPKGAPLLSERIGDYSYEIAGERMMGKLPQLGSLRQILSRYRDPF